MGVMDRGKQAISESYSYRAQGSDGAWVTGTLDAKNSDEARLRLSSMGLRVFELNAGTPRTAEEAFPKARRLGAEDFAAFNQQLAQLTKAGMPIESGLRLIASDMHSRRMAQAVESVARDLEHGTPLHEAFERRAKYFPKLYGSVLQAGITAGNLPAVLLNLGRHLELMQRLKRNLWRAASYPLMAFLAICCVLTFVGYVIEPEFDDLYSDYLAEIPRTTRLMFFIGRHTPLFLLFLAANVIGFWVLWRTSQRKGYEQRFVDRWLTWVPLLGRVIRANLVSRWCGAVALGVEAGLDLPRAIQLGAQATGSKVLEEDGQRVLVAHEAGEPIHSAGPVHLIPPSVLAAMEFGKRRGDLPQVLGTLTQIYAQKSEHHLATLTAILSPALIVMVAVILGLVYAALMMPLVKLMDALSF